MVKEYKRWLLLSRRSHGPVNGRLVGPSQQVRPSIKSGQHWVLFSTDIGPELWGGIAVVSLSPMSHRTAAICDISYMLYMYIHSRSLPRWSRKVQAAECYLCRHRPLPSSQQRAITQFVFWQACQEICLAVWLGTGCMHSSNRSMQGSFTIYTWSTHSFLLLFLEAVHDLGTRFMALSFLFLINLIMVKTCKSRSTT